MDGINRLLIRRINELSDEYKKLSNSLDDFVKNVYYLPAIALDIFYKLTQLYELPVEPVELHGVFEKSAQELLLESYSGVIVPEYGNIEVITSEGTVIFVDITKSTEYFMDKNGLEFKENYTGFVIFNSYILLVKTITRLTGGEFLEHTGDGALIFYKDRNIIEEYKSEFDENGICRFNEAKNPLCLYFIVSEYLKNYAKNIGLINFNSQEETNIISEKVYYVEPSLIHIGVSYGNVKEISLGDMKKLVSDIVWQAADNCKNARRIVKYYLNHYEETVYFELPIEFS